MHSSHDSKTISFILVGFRFLQVENVARILYFVNPVEPCVRTLVMNRLKIPEYLRKLSEAQLTGQTQKNYLKGLNR